jgi:hypothetical protein
MKIDPPSLNSGNAFCTANRVPRIQAEGRIEVLLGNLAQWHGLVRAGAREQDVDPALFPPDRIEQTVEVVEIGRVPLHAGHVPANQPDGLIELLLPPARDEHVGALFNEPPGARQRDSPRTRPRWSFREIGAKANSNVAHYGGGGAPTTIVCGSLSFDRASLKPITQLLPSFILMKAD